MIATWTNLTVLPFGDPIEISFVAVLVSIVYALLVDECLRKLAWSVAAAFTSVQTAPLWVTLLLKSL